MKWNAGFKAIFVPDEVKPGRHRRQTGWKITKQTSDKNQKILPRLLMSEDFTA